MVWSAAIEKESFHLWPGRENERSTLENSKVEGKDKKWLPRGCHVVATEVRGRGAGELLIILSFHNQQFTLG